MKAILKKWGSGRRRISLLAKLVLHVKKYNAEAMIGTMKYIWKLAKGLEANDKLFLFIDKSSEKEILNSHHLCFIELWSTTACDATFLGWYTTIENQDECDNELDANS